MTVLFNLDVSTHVTKSSICLEGKPGECGQWLVHHSVEYSPCNEVSRVRDIIGSDPDMTLLNKFDCLVFDEHGGQ